MVAIFPEQAGFLPSSAMKFKLKGHLCDTLKVIQVQLFRRRLPGRGKALCTETNLSMITQSVVIYNMSARNLLQPRVLFYTTREGMRENVAG